MRIRVVSGHGLTANGSQVRDALIFLPSVRRPATQDLLTRKSQVRSTSPRGVKPGLGSLMMALQLFEASAAAQLFPSAAGRIIRRSRAG